MLRHSALVICVATAAITGCGLGAGKMLGGGAEILITHDFGTKSIAYERISQIRESDTVIRSLQANHDVETRYGGNFVQSIDGVAGKGSTGTIDWFYFVNGVEASDGAADHSLDPGDVVQWDFRDWQQALRVPAIVGAFPEPFLHGIDGKKLPTRLECAEQSASACAAIEQSLADSGVTATTVSLGENSEPSALRIIVGPWADINEVDPVGKLAEETQTSGVYGRFSDAGLELISVDGKASVAELGTGLIAALKDESDQVVWVVSAVDEVGVDAAAKHFDQPSLRTRFAVTVTSKVAPLPVGP